MEDIIERIQDIYASSSTDEQKILRQILVEISETGYSSTYNDVWLADYKEIPVSIETFLTSDAYLGRTNRHGDAVYPYWRKSLIEFFNAGNKYQEWILTGATRIGKSTTAVTGASYMLYRLMCLRNPQVYFGLKDISKISILFFNITLDLAHGVAYREFSDTLRESPWFNAHGSFSKSDENFYYIPEGGKISIDYGSSGSHALGKQVYCLIGDTQIVTDSGVKTLAELSGCSVKVLQYKNDKLAYVPATVALTKYVDHTVRVTLNDDSIIEGTPDHKLLTASGKYEQLCNLENSALFDVDGCKHGIAVQTIEHIYYSVPIPVYDVVDAKPSHNFVIQSISRIVSHNCAIMDEMNFSQAGVKDVEKAKAKMKNTYDTITARVRGTFKHGGEVFGKIFAVSSKRSDSDFLEAYVRNQIESGAGDHMYISDAPQWEVKPRDTFSPESFYIAVGDRNRRGFVVPDNQCFPEALQELRDQGYLLLTPPLDMKPDFLADFEIALRDLAGIAVVGSLSFITQDVINQCISNRRNIFYQDVLQIGAKDSYTIEEFCHLENLTPLIRSAEWYIHLDLSKNTDRTGISAACITGRKDIENPSGKISVPMLSHAFSVALEAPRGDKISYNKILSFICWLRKQGIRIARISRDQFQSEYLAELLEANGFPTDLLSLDRTPDGYIALRSMLIEQRVDMLNVQLLQDELVHLQRDGNTGKVDHPVGGCFTIDTKIRLVDGRSLTIEELLIEQTYKDNWVYTINEATHEIEPKKIKKVFKTKYVSTLAEVTLDNGKVLHCTPDHKFMLLDGSFVEIQTLHCRSLLMSIDSIVSIVSVRLVDIPCDVYDLEIEDNHNFALDAGCFVHNSKDVADSFAGALWNASKNNPNVPIPSGNIIGAIAAVNGRRNVGGALPSMMPFVKR